MDIEQEMVEEAPTSSGNIFKNLLPLDHICLICSTWWNANVYICKYLFFFYIKLVKSREVLHCYLIQVMIIVQSDDLRDALNF